MDIIFHYLNCFVLTRSLQIHSIGQAEDGVVWEQLLLLAPCQIIALSATIGNPTAFANWLEATQKSSNFDLTMIQHHQRYSDLRKFIYSPPKKFAFEGLQKASALGSALGLDGTPNLTFMHPVSSLFDKSRGMPDDLSLEPRDCFLLWQSMNKFQTEDFKLPESLSPAKALPSTVRKVDIFLWEKELKKVLTQWMANRSSPFDKVLKDLTPDLPVLQSREAAHSIQPVSETIKDDPDALDPNDLKATTLPLLVQLHQRQALPVILFNYDRSGCEEIGAVLLKQLTEAEAKWKNESSQWKRLMDGWEKWKIAKEKKSAKKPVKASKKKGGDDDDEGSKEERARDEASGEGSFYDTFDPEEPQDDFSFADKRRCQKSELEKHVEELRWKHVPDYLIDCLQRGIGIHHAGMNRRYRQRYVGTIVSV